LCYQIDRCVVTNKNLGIPFDSVKGLPVVHHLRRLAVCSFPCRRKQDPFMHPQMLERNLLQNGPRPQPGYQSS
jgi:hypothetical protein